MNLNDKRSIFFVIFGWLCIIGGVFMCIVSIFTIFTFYKSYTYLLESSPELASAVSLPLEIFIVSFPIFLSVLYMVEGIGFIKFKRWLPNLLVIMLILGFSLQIIIFFNSAWYITNFFGGIIKFLGKDALTLWLGIILTYFTFKQRLLFVN